MAWREIGAQSDCTRCPEFDDCPGIAGNKEASDGGAASA